MDSAESKLIQLKVPDPKVCALEKSEVKCSYPGCAGPYNCIQRKDQWASQT